MYLYVSEITDKKQSKEKMLRSLRDYCKRTENKDFDSNEFTIETGVKGKPFLKSHPKVKFSVSHSGEWWILAIGSKEIGIDIEDMSLKNRATEADLRLGKRSFAKNELEVLLSKVDDIENISEKEHILVKENFYDIWTRKEAYLKYLSVGLGGGLKTFSVFDKILEPLFKEIFIALNVKVNVCCQEKDIKEIIVI